MRQNHSRNRRWIPILLLSKYLRTIYREFDNDYLLWQPNLRPTGKRSISIVCVACKTYYIIYPCANGVSVYIAWKDTVYLSINYFSNDNFNFEELRFICGYKTVFPRGGVRISWICPWSYAGNRTKASTSDAFLTTTCTAPVSTGYGPRVFLLSSDALSPCAQHFTDTHVLLLFVYKIQRTRVCSPLYSRVTRATQYIIYYTYCNIVVGTEKTPFWPNINRHRVTRSFVYASRLYVIYIIQFIRSVAPIEY